MDTTYSATGEGYPVKTSTVLDGELMEGVSIRSVDRVKDYIAATVQESGGTLSADTDPFVKDVAVLAFKYSHLLLTMKLIAEGRFSSTDENPQYAGGNVGPGSRIYTPQEAAQNVLDEINKFA